MLKSLFGPTRGGTFCVRCGFMESEEVVREFNGERYDVHLLEKLLV